MPVSVDTQRLLCGRRIGGVLALAYGRSRVTIRHSSDPKPIGDARQNDRPEGGQHDRISRDFDRSHLVARRNKGRQDIPGERAPSEDDQHDPASIWL